MSIVDEVKSVIDSGNYNDSDELVKSYLEGLEMYKTLKKNGLLSSKKRILPNIFEKILLRQKVEFNCTMK